MKIKLIKEKKQDRWEKPPCNNCEGRNYKVVWDNLTSWEHTGIFRIVKCNNCELFYLNPRPKISEIGKYYPKQSYWGRDVREKNQIDNVKKEREYGFGSIYKFILNRKKKGAILDIGAGTGIFLSKFKELGWAVDGVELSNDAVKFSKNTLAINLKKGDFLDFHFPDNSFDFVTLNNALEHLYDPSRTLRKINKSLKDNGMVIITVPNIESLGIFIFGKKWHALQPPRHLYHFSEKTLKEMLEKSGFRVTGINRWYYAHNYYTIFESFRFNISPRFKKKEAGSLVNSKYEKKFSVKKEIGKVIVKLISIIIVLSGSLLRKSEIISVYAVKK